MKKIVLTGPECTGKTTLAKALAEHYQTAWVPEFARDYLNRLNRPYVEDDLLQIAKGQLDLESQFEGESRTHLFYDTDLTVIKVWQEYKFGRCSNKLLSWMNSKQYNLYLLMEPDIQWQSDCLRENPNDRKELFGIYTNELKDKGASYITISGNSDERLKTAIKAIDQIR